MGSKTLSPFVIRCSHCGAPAKFDIRRQNYRCEYCDGVSSLEAPVTQARLWREQAGGQKQTEMAAHPAVVCSCPGCGARVLLSEGEALETCTFCGTTLVRREYAGDADRFPETVLPFRLNRTQAAEKLRAWAEENPKRKEAKAVLSHLPELKGWYLPYRLVKGPVDCDVTRQNSFRHYNCGGFVDGLAVNVSSHFQNDLLDAAEPFDLDAAEPFRWDFVAGHHIKIEDLDEGETAGRVSGEIEEAYRPSVERAMQTTGIGLDARVSHMLTLPTLLPMYYLPCGDGVCAAVNGQTGKVAVTGGTQKVRAYLIEPTVLTVLFGLLWSGVLFGKFYGWELTLMGTLVSAILLFVIFTQDRTAKLRSRFFITGKKHENSGVEPPVFFEPVAGERTAVKPRFYTPGRLIRWLGAALPAVLLPAVLAAILALLGGRSLQEVLHLPYGYGAAWYCLSVPCALVVWFRLGRSAVYDHPLFQTVDPPVRRVKSDAAPVESQATDTKQALRVLFTTKLIWVTLGILFVLILSVVVILD